VKKAVYFSFQAEKRGGLFFRTAAPKRQSFEAKKEGRLDFAQLGGPSSLKSYPENQRSTQTQLPFVGGGRRLLLHRRAKEKEMEERQETACSAEEIHMYLCKAEP